MVASVEQQARFPDFRLERISFAAFPISFLRSVTMADGSYAMPVHSGGNRAGFTPASLVTLDGHL